MLHSMEVVLSPLSTTSQLSICTSKEVKNLQQQPVHSRESATARRAQEKVQPAHVYSYVAT